MRCKYPVPRIWLCGAISLLMCGLSLKSVQAQGILRPSVVLQPLGLSVLNGGTATFTVIGLSVLSPTTFKWRLNDVEIPNAQVANSTDILGLVSILTVTNINAQKAGNYSVEISNPAGSVVSANALLISLSSVTSILSSELKTNGFHLRLGIPTGTNYVISASTDLASWIPLTTNVGPATNVTFVDTGALNYSSRFYRVQTQ